MQVTNEELRALKPLVVAVVGPTNEGKTSILRTLTSDPNFGLVNAYNGTTVRAEIQKIFYKGVVEILQLVDTPGFQTSGEIYELLMEDEAVQERLGAFDLDDLFRVVPQQDDDFRHDLRAWREVARCDAVIFVVNVVENPKQSLLKYTLALLKRRDGRGRYRLPRRVGRDAPQKQLLFSAGVRRAHSVVQRRARAL